MGFSRLSIHGHLRLGHAAKIVGGNGLHKHTSFDQVLRWDDYLSTMPWCRIWNSLDATEACTYVWHRSQSAFNPASRAARGPSGPCRLTWAMCTRITTVESYEPDDTAGGSGQGNVFDGAEGGFDDSPLLMLPQVVKLYSHLKQWCKEQQPHGFWRHEKAIVSPLSVVDIIISDLQSLLHVAHSQLLEAIELPLREASVSSEVAERIRSKLCIANPASIFEVCKHSPSSFSTTLV